MKVGFTGTRSGMTQHQMCAFGTLVRELRTTTFHHGACVGADTDAAVTAGLMSHAPVHIVAHPGKSAMGGDNELLSQKALAVSAEVRDAKTHFARNRDIVNESDVLVATPWQSKRPAPKSGGGTWMTIEYAEKVGKRVHIIWPCGTIEVSGIAAVV